MQEALASFAPLPISGEHCRGFPVCCLTDADDALIGELIPFQTRWGTLLGANAINTFINLT